MNAHAGVDLPPAVRTTCPYCGVGCGVIARPDRSGGADISGDVDHPANFGRLCSKGSALGETLGLETRLLHPIVDNARASWTQALDRVANGFARTIATHGADSVAFYLSGQLLTEDYYVANKLMKGFIGSANVDTNSRLCMASSVAGHKRAFGSDTVPGCYEDLDEADLLVLVGSNAAWCHPTLFQRMMRAKESRGARIVNIDPRRTATAEGADLHLSVAPGMDSALFAGLLVYLADGGAADGGFIARATENFDVTLAAARAIAPDIATVARKTGIERADIESFFAMWAATPRVVTLYSQGVNQSARGTDKVNAIVNCHLATGRIGHPGAGPFSLTGQPNAMGGREVGGLANQLAAHMGFSPVEIDRVGRFWRATNMARREGLKAVDLFDAIGRGEIKALWVMGTNPAVSLPRADAARRALASLDLFVVSENVASNDTVNAGAHVLLPAAAWGEKDGTVTNSERRISRQRPFLVAAGEARPDWWIICEVAKRLGFGEAFAFEKPADIFAEHAALSSFENDGQRDFDLSGLVGLDGSAYDRLKPVQWPIGVRETKGRARLFADERYFTTNAKARFVPVDLPEQDMASPAFPFVLNTGRVRDQWHTMTRTGLSQRLARHIPEPFIEIHPIDARTLDLVSGALAQIATPHGKALMRVVVTDAQRPGMLFAPIHWNDETAAGARIGALVHDLTDPHSGQPDSKATPASIEPIRMARAGFVLSRERRRLPTGGVHAWSAIEGGYATRFATDASVESLAAAIGAGARMLRYTDPARRIERMASIKDDRLEAVLFVGDIASDAPWTGLMSAWTADTIDGAMRRALLSGRIDASAPPPGPLVCACFSVSEPTISAAIAAGATTTEAVGRACRAGGNCGSCLPEIRRMLAAARVVEATAT